MRSPRMSKTSIAALEQPVLVGHSMGGMVVQTLLRRRPEHYRAAVLSCTSPAFGNPAGDFQKKFVADRLAPLDAGKTMAECGARRGRQHHGAECRSGRTRAVHRAIRRRARGDLSGGGAMPRHLRRARQSGRTSRSRCCALRPSMTATRPGRWWRRWPARSPARTTLCLPGLGHMPNLEAPAAFDAAIFSFLDHALARRTDSLAHEPRPSTRTITTRRFSRLMHSGSAKRRLR